MKWIILISDKPLCLDRIKNIVHDDSIGNYFVDKNRVCVDFGDDHIFYDYVEKNEIKNDYELDEWAKIPYDNPHFIMMVYTSDERLKKVLSQQNFLKDIYVDDDHGQILPIEEFISLM